MGSSKKHKERDRDREHGHDREHKRKRKHRSRSRERSDRRRPKDEKRRKHEYAAERDAYADERSLKTDADTMPSEHTVEQLTLSIEDTNKIRAKLGLKPLETPGGSKSKKEETSKKDDVHVPAVNLSAVRKTEALRKRMAELKEKRRINIALGKVKTLADSDSDDGGALAWVKKSRKVEIEKQKAEKQAKMLEEMDAQFGIGDLVEEAFDKKKKYTSKDLTGLKVQHDQETFAEGKSVILTLQDRGILDEEGEDTLVNVNMIDDEIANKNVENKKKKPDYNPYDDQFDEFGMLKAKDVLEKYNEEIDGTKREAFKLGSGGKYNTEMEKREQAIKQEIQSRGETLSLPKPNIAVEYYTSEEMTFNKVKKKTRKLRKKAKVVTADDLLQMGEGSGYDMGSRDRKHGQIKSEEVKEKSAPIPGLDLVETNDLLMDIDMDIEEADPLNQNEILGPEEDLTGVPVEEDAAAFELETALRKARKVRQKKDSKLDIGKMFTKTIKQESMEQDAADVSVPGGRPGSIVLNSISEFCRSLGEIPTYGLAGNRIEEEDEIVDFDRDLSEQNKNEDMQDEEPLAGWQSVEIDTRPVEIKEEEKAVLDDEPVVNEGLAAALSLAHKKGYLDQNAKKSISAPAHMDLTAKSYSIEDKRYDDLDEKYRKRDRYVGGMVSDFKDKPSYAPDVKLEYIDDKGHIMNSKEAFRYLSHRFHGKGSGKKKTEKRQKKLEEEQLMKSMSSTDTPLNTVALLKEKQKMENSAFILLSGSGKGIPTLSK